MDFNSLAAECAPYVAPQTLSAIVRTESGFKPLAIGINGGAKLERQPLTKDEAVVTAKWLMTNGYNIDMGLGQINSANLPKIGLSVEDAFDPCKNLAAAASILQSNYLSASRYAKGEQEALHAALSAYNTGSFSKGFSNGYVQKVIGNAAGVSANPIPIAKTNVPAASKVGRTAEQKQVPAKGQRVDFPGGVAREASPFANELDPSNRDVMVYR